ncbi:Uncharacterized membrane protein YsdA, DUF1294 family [Faecalicatena contorta]|uniref:Uncharacterized membrane protein YsdA, DUF1294 family n=2 Tax=Faecalicatena contorta TaxID=39482 RepID=A0A316A1T0_9FIRM|nr:uncharacterized membrane protein YsdA (DUF1294 family) [Faecalicatena contorta]SUQ13058.1 Uncharacterized membrane protein YsdA, DUF1294 family [Faecalicatena contorta]
MRYLYIIIMIMNFITFFVYGEDKRRARKGGWRIPEKTLLLLALLGGGAGALLGMRVFHHKTQKALFKIGVPCILIFQVIVLGWSFRVH